MSEKRHEPFQVAFNSAVRIDFQGSRVTSEGGLLVVREHDCHAKRTEGL
jgi:hypothetical protein